MRLSPGGPVVDLSKGKDAVIALIDQRISELKAEENADLFNREEERKRKAEESRNAIIASFIKWSGVPERYQEATLKGWVTEGDKQAALKPKLIAWAGSLEVTGGTSEVWIGPAGTGKTHLACGMLMDRYQDCKDGLYITAKGYTDKIKNSYRDTSRETSTDILDRYGSTPILVIDEVGRQFDAKSEELYFFELVNERYNRRRPTLFLSNLSDEEFRAFVGTAIMDRLKEGGGRFVPFNWESRRK